MNRSNLLWAATLASVMLGGEVATGADPVRYAGIDIGSKGVKGVVIEIGGEAVRNPVKVVLSKSTNPTLGLLKDGKFRPGAVDEVAADVKAFLDQFQKEKVPAGNIWVSGSSSVAAVADKDELVAAVKRTAGVPMTFVTAEEEVRLTIDGLTVQGGDRQSTLVIDIGSGNTKGGYYTGPETVASFAIPFGTVSFTSAAKAQAGDNEFSAKVAAAREAVLAPALAKAIAAQSGMKQKAPVTLIGGAVWAWVTLAKPSAVDVAMVPLTVADLKAYKAQLTAAKGRFPNVDTSGITDPEARKKAEDEVDRVRDVFTPENLVAGSELLDALFVSLELENKTVRFARSGMVAWVLAKVTPKDRLTALRQEPHEGPKPETKKPVPPPTEPVVPGKTPPAPMNPQQSTPPSGKVPLPTPETTRVPLPSQYPVIGGYTVVGPCPAVGPRVVVYQQPRLLGRLRRCR